MDTPKLTAKQYLKLHPDQYILVTYEFSNPVFIAPLKDLQIQVTANRTEAEIWTELDHTSTKLEYHVAVTGYRGLKFEKIVQTLKRYSINNVLNVKQFFNDIHELYPLEWHPDDDFIFFMKEDEITRAFTDEEAKYLNQVMRECFQFCDDHEMDIYEVAGEVQTELWKKQGKWPSDK